MNVETIKKNKLGTILQFSIPSIIAMLLSTLITITDGYFTGNYIGEEALAAINLGLPILYFYLGVGLCVGVGGTVICGRLLGCGRTENRNGAAYHDESDLISDWCGVCGLVHRMGQKLCGDAKASALISSLRGVILLLIFTFVFPALWGMTGVWMATPATETLTAIVSAWLIRKQKRMIGWKNGKVRRYAAQS